jgi:hypothetical protein
LHYTKGAQRCKNDYGCKVPIAIQLLKFDNINHAHFANKEEKQVISGNNNP